MSGAIGASGRQEAWDAIASDAPAAHATQAAEAPAAAELPGLQRGQATSCGRMAALAALQAPARDPRLDALVHALRTEPREELEATLAAAQKDDPQLFREALREVFTELVGDSSRLVVHNMAMDRNNDGWMTFSEAYTSMRDMGFGRMRAFLLSGLTALALAPQTNDERRFEVKVADSDKSERAMFRNGFDTNEELEQRLDEVMAEDLDGKGYVDQADIDRMVDKRVSTMDSKLGARALAYLNKGEWQALLSLTDGKLTRGELRDFYKGSLFFSFLTPANLAEKIVTYRERAAAGQPAAPR